jgi:hypothetical protein
MKAGKNKNPHENREDVAENRHFSCAECWRRLVKTTEERLLAQVSTFNKLSFLERNFMHFRRMTGMPVRIEKVNRCRVYTLHS